MKIKHYANILVGDYPFVDSFRKEVLSLIKFETYSIPKNNTHVKAWHTDWMWQPENLKIINFKNYLIKYNHYLVNFFFHLSLLIIHHLA